MRGRVDGSDEGCGEDGWGVKRRDGRRIKKVRMRREGRGGSCYSVEGRRSVSITCLHFKWDEMRKE
jgi:hypothetical protein